MPKKMTKSKKLDFNKKVTTRTGEAVRIICTNRLDNTYPVVALLDNGSCEEIVTYSESGRFYIHDTSSRDLINPETKHEAWINLYKYNQELYTGVVYKTKEQALGKKTSSNYIDTIKIQWEE